MCIGFVWWDRKLLGIWLQVMVQKIASQEVDHSGGDAVPKTMAKRQRKMAFQLTEIKETRKLRL